MIRATTLLSWTARVFGDEIADRVFVPLVADWQREFAQAPHSVAKASAALRGVLAFGVATLAVGAGLAAHGPTDPTVLRRGGVVLAGFACVGAGLLLLPFAPWVGARGPQVLRTVPFLLPSVAAISLPFALVPAAMALAAGTRRSTRWRHRATLGMVAMTTAICLSGLLGWIVPVSNQAWREAIAGRRVAIDPGMDRREMSVIELRAAAVGSLAAQRDTWSGADAALELLRRTAIATTWPLALVFLGWRLGRHRPSVSMARLVLWWALPFLIIVGLQPALQVSSVLDVRSFMRTPEFSAAAVWCAMALALRPNDRESEATAVRGARGHVSTQRL